MYLYANDMCRVQMGSNLPVRNPRRPRTTGNVDGPAIVHQRYQWADILVAASFACHLSDTQLLNQHDFQHLNNQGLLNLFYLNIKSTSQLNNTLHSECNANVDDQKWSA